MEEPLVGKMPSCTSIVYLSLESLLKAFNDPWSSRGNLEIPVFHKAANTRTSMVETKFLSLRKLCHVPRDCKQSLGWVKLSEYHPETGSFPVDTTQAQVDAK